MGPWELNRSSICSLLACVRCALQLASTYQAEDSRAGQRFGGVRGMGGERENEKRKKKPGLEITSMATCGVKSGEGEQRIGTK
jgi:hypothetical protein